MPILLIFAWKSSIHLFDSFVRLLGCWPVRRTKTANSVHRQDSNHVTHDTRRSRRSNRLSRELTLVVLCTVDARNCEKAHKTATILKGTEIKKSLHIRISVFVPSIHTLILNYMISKGVWDRQRAEKPNIQVKTKTRFAQSTITGGYGAPFSVLRTSMYISIWLSLNHLFKVDIGASRTRTSKDVFQ